MNITRITATIDQRHSPFRDINQDYSTDESLRLSSYDSPARPTGDSTGSRFESLSAPMFVQEALQSFRLSRDLKHLESQPERSVQGAATTYQNAQFTDGTTAVLITFAGSLQIMIRNEPDSGTSFYQVNGTDIRRLEAGESVSDPASVVQLGTATVTINADGQGLSASGVSGFMSFRSASFELDAQTGVLQGASFYSGPSFGLPVEGPVSSELIADNILHGAALIDAYAPVGNSVSAADTFDYYSKTPEGAAILARESSFYSGFDASQQQLFVARVQLLRGEGGIELFEPFMPNRTALLDDPGKLADYDEQFDRFFQHMSSSSSGRSGGTPASQLDVGLRTIMAAAAAEALWHSPDHVSMVISDLDRGWSMADDLGTAGGRYSWWKPLFDSQKGHITLDLGSTLFSFSDPNDAYDVLAHEMAHALDGFGNDKPDGLPAFSNAEDKRIFLEERNRLFTAFRNTPASLPFTSDMDYAFENEREFLARFSELFLTNRASAETVKAVSPELYGVLSRFYQRTYP